MNRLEDPIDIASLPEVLNRQEFFAVMRLGHTAGYDSLRRGDFPFAGRVGRVWRISRSALLRWLEQEVADHGSRSSAYEEAREERHDR